jgi:hypothetical protein
MTINLALGIVPLSVLRVTGRVLRGPSGGTAPA